MNECVVIGAGGHARSLLGLLRHCGLDARGIYDDSWDADGNEVIQNISVQGVPDDIPADADIALAVGDNRRRQQLFDRFRAQMLERPLIHPHATVENFVRLGSGVQVFARAFVNCEVEIGDNCIINSGSIVEHESQVGAHSHVAVGAVLCGRTQIGARVLVGAGAVVNPGVKVCDDAVIGSGAVVSRNITEAGVYTGMPARRRS